MQRCETVPEVLAYFVAIIGEIFGLDPDCVRAGLRRSDAGIEENSQKNLTVQSGALEISASGSICEIVRWSAQFRGGG